MTGWRAVHAMMEAAGLDGPHASPKAELGGHPPHRLCLGLQIAGQKHAELAGGKVRTVTTDKIHDRRSQDAGKSIAEFICDHFSYALLCPTSFRTEQKLLTDGCRAIECAYHNEEVYKLHRFR
jgi:hypothetical protein